jgi:hypothetical protein
MRNTVLRSCFAVGVLSLLCSCGGDGDSSSKKSTVSLAQIKPPELLSYADSLNSCVQAIGPYRAPSSLDIEYRKSQSREFDGADCCLPGSEEQYEARFHKKGCYAAGRGPDHSHIIYVVDRCENNLGQPMMNIWWYWDHENRHLIAEATTGDDDDAHRNVIFNPLFCPFPILFLATRPELATMFLLIEPSSP